MQIQEFIQYAERKSTRLQNELEIAKYNGDISEIGRLEDEITETEDFKIGGS